MFQIRSIIICVLFILPHLNQSYFTSHSHFRQQSNWIHQLIAYLTKSTHKLFLPVSSSCHFFQDRHNLTWNNTNVSGIIKAKLTLYQERCPRSQSSDWNKSWCDLASSVTLVTIYSNLQIGTSGIFIDIKSISLYYRIIAMCLNIVVWSVNA